MGLHVDVNLCLKVVSSRVNVALTLVFVAFANVRKTLTTTLRSKREVCVSVVLFRDPNHNPNQNCNPELDTHNP